MKLSLTICLGSLALSHGYYLDSGCAPYADMITAGMKGALNLAQAGSDIFSSPSAGRNKLQAQQDLISYLFAATSASSAMKKTVTDRFAAVLSYNTNGGNPMGTLSAARDTDFYRALTFKDVVFFCDYSRFQENRSCDGSYSPGVACDELTRIRKFYTRAKRLSLPKLLRGLDNTLSVCPGKQNVWFLRWHLFSLSRKWVVTMLTCL